MSMPSAPAKRNGGLHNLFLGVPTMTGLMVAGVVIVVFLVGAYFLYIAGGKSSGHYGVKLADFMLQGAIVSVLFAILKAIIDASRH